MCPICGIVSSNDEDVSNQLRSMMSALSQKEPAGTWLVSNGMSAQRRKGDESATAHVLGQVSLATREQPVEHPSFGRSGNLSVLYEGNLYNEKEIGSYFQLNQEPCAICAAEIAAHLLEESYQGNLAAALKQVAQMVDGAYCLAASDGRQSIVMRDTIGLRPVFYAVNGELMAFASRKTALWEIGLRNVRPLRAGMLASLDGDGIRFDEAQPLDKNEIETIIDEPTMAVDSYCALLRTSVEKRLHNLKKVGVLVSGGVDSCLIAKLVSDMAADRGIEVTIYTAGVHEADDVRYAESFSRDLGLKHRVRRLQRGEIESYISQVIASVEERDVVQIEAGIGVYAALEMAAQDGMKVIFSGQGPDELWGGYTWYPRIIANEGYEGLEQRMWSDLERADIETLDRENRIAMAHGVEEVFPYLDAEVVRLAMSVSPHLKISSARDKVGKHPHREAAKRLGLPAQYADRSKDAAQHGTGTHAALDAVARKNGFTPDLVSLTGYRSEEVSDEKLASSTRYGYRYAERELWQTPEHVQFLLDSVAYENGLLNQAERLRIEQLLKKVRSL